MATYLSHQQAADKKNKTGATTLRAFKSQVHVGRIEQSELHQLSSHEPISPIPDQVQNKAK
jgi:hypothetical protein